MAAKKGAKKKKKKKAQVVMDVSEEYERLEFGKDMKNTGRVYVDRPKEKEIPSYRPTNFEMYSDNFYPSVREKQQIFSNNTARSGYNTMRSAFDPQFIT